MCEKNEKSQVSFESHLFLGSASSKLAHCTYISHKTTLNKDISSKSDELLHKLSSSVSEVFTLLNGDDRGLNWGRGVRSKHFSAN